MIVSNKVQQMCEMVSRTKQSELRSQRNFSDAVMQFHFRLTTVHEEHSGEGFEMRCENLKSWNVLKYLCMNQLQTQFSENSRASPP